MNDQLKEYYELIRYSVDLQDIRLKSLQCQRLDGENRNIVLKLQRNVEVVDGRAKIDLSAIVTFEEEGPFYIETELEGLCVPTREISEEELKEYAYEQVTPLLLPYVREIVTNALSRMDLPIYYIPTMDVLKSLEANKEDIGQE